MITTVSLTPITMCSYNFCFIVMRTFIIYSLSNLHIYNTIYYL